MKWGVHMNTYKVKYSCWGVGLTRYDGEIEITAIDEAEAEVKTIKMLRSKFDKGAFSVRSVELK